MKQIGLKDVMSNMVISMREDGFIMSSAAGTARYDAYGTRRTVTGIPEYFPVSLHVEDRTPKGDSSVGGNISKEVRQWSEKSEQVADVIDKHLYDFPEIDLSNLDGKRVAIHLGTRYTVISGLVKPDAIPSMLKMRKSDGE